MEDKLPYKIIEVKNGDINHYEAVDTITGKTVWSSAFPKKPHPSDSDIEKEAKEFTEQNHAKTDMKGAYTYSGYIAGAESLRDRMNGEIENALNDFLNGLLCRKDIHIKNPVCSNSIAEAVNDYLQKFRNRDL